MDKEAFIAEVRKREFLWKRNIVQLHAAGKEQYDKLWKEVGGIFGISGHVAQRKWRSIRDQFYKLLNMKNVPVYTTGNTFHIKCKDKPRWKYFNDLTFVLHNYMPQQNIINVNGDSAIEIPSSCNSESSCEEVNLTTEENTLPSFSEEQDNDSNISEVDIKEVEPERIYHEEARVPITDSVPPSVKSEEPAPSFTSIKRIYTLQESDDLNLSTSTDEQYVCSPKKVALESNVNQRIRPRANEETTDEDEHLIFFRSLLPFMKKLDPIQQLRVRMRCQESLLEELGGIRRN